MSKNLSFSQNWNGKLHTTVFHTLRRSSRFEVGDIVEIYLNDKLLGSATCISKTRYNNAANIPEEICFLDTGYGNAETQGILSKMYKDEDSGLAVIYGYLFKWIQTTGERKSLKKAVQLSFEI